MSEEIKEIKEVQEAPKKITKPAKRYPAEPPVNKPVESFESPVASRATSVTRGLSKKGVEGMKREAAETSSDRRGQDLANKFIVRAAQRNG
jgi:hypothetical protein